MKVGPDLPGGKENLQHAPDFPQRSEMMPGGTWPKSGSTRFYPIGTRKWLTHWTTNKPCLGVYWLMTIVDCGCRCLVWTSWLNPVIWTEVAAGAQGRFGETPPKFGVVGMPGNAWDMWKIWEAFFKVYDIHRREMAWTNNLWYFILKLLRLFIDDYIDWLIMTDPFAKIFGIWRVGGDGTRVPYGFFEDHMVICFTHVSPCALWKYMYLQRMDVWTFYMYSRNLYILIFA